MASTLHPAMMRGFTTPLRRSTTGVGSIHSFLPLSRAASKRTMLTRIKTTTVAPMTITKMSSLSSSVSPNQNIADSSARCRSDGIKNQLLFQQRSWFSSYPPHELVGLPKLSPTMESGSIGSWNLEEGDEFGPGDVLCSIETDKATVDFEAQDDGVIAKILVEAGPDEVQLGAPIVITVEEKDDASAFKDYVLESKALEIASISPGADTPTPPPPTAAPIAAISTPPPALHATSSSIGGNHVVASPLARMLSSQMGYDISQIQATGPGGRILAADVKEFVSTATATETRAATEAVSAPALQVINSEPIPGFGYTDYPIDAIAKETAALLAQSKRNVPHYYLTIDITMDNLLELRSTLNGINGKPDEEKLGVYELIIKAAGSAMKAVPMANASWMDSVVRVYDSVDINLVMGSGDNLIQPIICDVGSKGLKSISADLNTALSYLQEQEEGTREGKNSDVVLPTTGMGTFTVINLGMYNIKSCAPIITEPQSCALAIGTLENRIVPNEDDDSDEIYKESVVMTATLSCDHRVIDGAVGAQWLNALKSHIENPTTLLL